MRSFVEDSVSCGYSSIKNEESGLLSKIKVNHRLLSEEARQGVVEEFVLREGTDYGHKDWSLDEKRTAILKQLDSGSLELFFDHESETCNILPSA